MCFGHQPPGPFAHSYLKREIESRRGACACSHSFLIRSKGKERNEKKRRERRESRDRRQRQQRIKEEKETKVTKETKETKV